LERLKQSSSKCSKIRLTEEGVLLKVMARGSFEQGQQVWIIDRDGSKVGATVENIVQETIDSEVTLSTVLPA
jgi:hypothetical protein